MDTLDKIVLTAQSASFAAMGGVVGRYFLNNSPSAEDRELVMLSIYAGVSSLIGTSLYFMRRMRRK